MANDDIEKELAELRARVEQLASERRARESGEMPVLDPDAVDSPTDDDDGTKEAREETNGDPTIIDHVRDLIENLDEELQETKPLTLLGVFALGLLVGRLTAK